MTLRSSNRCLILILENLPLILRWTVWMSSPDYQSMTGSGKIFNKRIKERINELKLKLEASTDVSGFKDAVTAFYKDFGVGKLRTSQGIPHSAQGKGRGGDRADHKYCPCEIRRSGRL